MHEISFSDAVKSDSFSVLSLNLTPYSLGHEVLLYKIRSPFVCLSDSQFDQLSIVDKIIALRRAVLICSNNWKENHRPQRWLKIWGWWTRNANILSEIQTFRNYLSKGHFLLPPPDATGPGHNFPCADEVLNGKRDDGHSRKLGGPFLAQLYNFMAKQNFDGCIWDISLPFAATLYFTHLEMEGSFRIENFEELEEKEHLFEQCREFLAEKKTEEEQKKTGLATQIPDALK